MFDLIKKQPLSCLETVWASINFGNVTKFPKSDPLRWNALLEILVPHNDIPLPGDVILFRDYSIDLYIHAQYYLGNGLVFELHADGWDPVSRQCYPCVRRPKSLSLLREGHPSFACHKVQRS